MTAMTYDIYALSYITHNEQKIIFYERRENCAYIYSEPLVVFE